MRVQLYRKMKNDYQKHTLSLLDSIISENTRDKLHHILYCALTNKYHDSTQLRKHFKLTDVLDFYKALKETELPIDEIYLYYTNFQPLKLTLKQLILDNRVMSDDNVDKWLNTMTAEAEDSDEEDSDEEDSDAVTKTQKQQVTKKQKQIKTHSETKPSFSKGETQKAKAKTLELHKLYDMNVLSIVASFLTISDILNLLQLSYDYYVQTNNRQFLRFVLDCGGVMEVNQKQAKHINEIFTTYWLKQPAQTIIFEGGRDDSKIIENKKYYKYPKFTGTNVVYYEGAHIILDDLGRKCPNLKTMIYLDDEMSDTRLEETWLKFKNAIEDNPLGSKIKTFGTRDDSNIIENKIPPNCSKLLFDHSHVNLHEITRYIIANPICEIIVLIGCALYGDFADGFICREGRESYNKIKLLMIDCTSALTFLSYEYLMRSICEIYVYNQYEKIQDYGTNTFWRHISDPVYFPNVKRGVLGISFDKTKRYLRFDNDDGPIVSIRQIIRRVFIDKGAVKWDSFKIMLIAIDNINNTSEANILDLGIFPNSSNSLEDVEFALSIQIGWFEDIWNGKYYESEIYHPEMDKSVFSDINDDSDSDNNTNYKNDNHTSEPDNGKKNTNDSVVHQVAKINTNNDDKDDNKKLTTHNVGSIDSSDESLAAAEPPDTAEPDSNKQETSSDESTPPPDTDKQWQDIFIKSCEACQ